MSRTAKRLCQQRSGQQNVSTVLGRFSEVLSAGKVSTSATKVLLSTPQAEGKGPHARWGAAMASASAFPMFSCIFVISEALVQGR